MDDRSTELLDHNDATTPVIGCTADLLLDIVFFKAEDGIRELTVTGLQTCALPISTTTRSSSFPSPQRSSTRGTTRVCGRSAVARLARAGSRVTTARISNPPAARMTGAWKTAPEIGRASCWERV